jgi:hypothetical protein
MITWASVPVVEDTYSSSSESSISGESSSSSSEDANFSLEFTTPNPPADVEICNGAYTWDVASQTFLSSNSVSTIKTTMGWKLDDVRVGIPSYSNICSTGFAYDVPPLTDFVANINSTLFTWTFTSIQQPYLIVSNSTNQTSLPDGTKFVIGSYDYEFDNYVQYNSTSNQWYLYLDLQSGSITANNDFETEMSVGNANLASHYTAYGAGTVDMDLTWSYDDPFYVMSESSTSSSSSSSSSSQTESTSSSSSSANSSSSSSSSSEAWPYPFDLPRIYVYSYLSNGFQVKFENIPADPGYIDFSYYAQ